MADAEPTKRQPFARTVQPGRRNGKRAAQLVGTIAQKVIAQGWPVGSSLGSEPELREEYGVSRMAFREAVRILEHQQVVRTRRGPGGGIFVTEPTVEAVMDTVVLYLYRIHASADELIEALIVLEEIACELAAARLDEGGVERLRAAVSAASKTEAHNPLSFHLLLATLSGNAALELFVSVLNRVLILYARDDANAGRFESGRALAAIGRAILDHDVALAKRRIRKHFNALREQLRTSSRAPLPFRGNVDVKLSGEIARAIAASIVERNLQPGDLVGREEDLIRERQVSRDVFREAIRLLEHHSVAEMRRGHGGGLFVLEPSVTPVADIAAIYLAWAGMDLDSLSTLRSEVETAVAVLAATRITADGRSRLRDVVDSEAAAGAIATADTLTDLHTAIASVAGNSVLELVALVLIRLNRLSGSDQMPHTVRRRILAEAQRTHEGIAHAIETGDIAMARTRMRTHQEAIAELLRSGRSRRDRTRS